MRPFVHTLMLWILIVSLPAQGVAAAITITCTIAHASAPRAGAGPVDDCADSGMTPQQAQGFVGGRVHRGMPCDQGGHHKHASCLACTGCCAGASAPPPSLFAGLHGGRIAERCARAAPSFTGWIPSRIERPPRV
jgi:hypothetical protein